MEKENSQLQAKSIITADTSYNTNYHKEVTEQCYKVSVMSSREIAQLTSKQHQHVKRDIEKMFSELGGDASKFGRIYYDSLNRGQIEYLLDRDHTDCLLTGYSALLRMKVIKRWKELENSNSLQVPTTMTEALELALAQSKQIDIQQIYINKTKDDVEFSHAVRSSKKGVLLEEFANAAGLGRNRLFKWLREAGILREDKHTRYSQIHNVPYQRYIDAGYFELKRGWFSTPRGEERENTTLITGKGEKWLTIKLIDAGLIPSKTPLAHL